MKARKLLPWVVVAVLSLVFAGVALAFGVGNVDGIWGTVEDGGGATCDGWASAGIPAFSATNPNIQGGNVTDENQVRYGVPQYMYSCPDTWSEFLLQSGFGFNGVNGVTGVDMDEPFYLGSFVHYNRPIYAADNPMLWVDLAVSVPIDCDDDGDTDTTFMFDPRFYLEETPNDPDDNPGDVCPYTPNNTTGCSDLVTVENPSTTSFTCGGTQYTVSIHGFTTNTDCATVYDADAVDTTFVTLEDATNSACLWAEIDLPTADVGVAKTCTGFNGQDPHYVVTVVNYGPGTALGATIVDTLPNGVTYASYTSQRTVNNVTTSQGTCSAVGQTVTCHLNAALPETTGDSSAKWVVDINVDYAAVQNPSFLNSVTVSTSSTDNNSANNTGTTTCEPTAVEQLSFAATGERTYIQLAWETATEVNNLGFNLYRATKLDGPKMKLNEELILSASPGSSSGAFYEYADTPEKLGKTFYYWLESVDIYGRTQLHGPVSAALAK